MRVGFRRQSYSVANGMLTLCMVAFVFLSFIVCGTALLNFVFATFGWELLAGIIIGYVLNEVLN